MKYKPYLLFILLLSYSSLQGICQAVHKPVDTIGRTLTFKEGLWLNPLQEAIKPKKASDTIFRGTINGTPNKLPALKKVIYPKLLNAAQATLDSLNDPGTGLSSFYQLVLAPSAYTDQIKSFKIIINHLDSHRITKIDSNNAVTDKIDRVIGELSIMCNYRAYSNFIGRTSTVEIKIYGDDLLKKFVQLYYKNYVDSYNKLLKEDTFIASRKDLQRLLNESIALPKITDFICNGTDPAKVLKDAIDSNILFKWFKDYWCNQDLLWMSGGSIRLTPYSVAVKYDWPKLQLFDRIIKFKIDSMKRCSDTDPSKIEALIRADSTGRKRFKTSGTAVLGFKNRKDILTDQAFLNDLLIPVLLPENKTGKGYFSPYKEKFILNYDAFKGYKLDQPYVRPAISEDEQLIISVNNVTAGNSVIISGTDVTIDDKSKAQGVLTDIGTSMAGASTSINPIGSLGPLINTNPIPVISNQSINISSSGVLHPGPRDKSRNKLLYEINASGRILYFPETNSRDILMAYISKSGKDQQAGLKKAVDFFVDNCAKGEISGSVEQEVKKLTTSFEEFLKYNRDLPDRRKLSNEIKKLYYLIPNFEDAQPFEPVKDTKGDAPKYHTTLSSFDFIKAPKEKDYVVTEEVQKPVKPGSTPKTVYDAAATDSVKTNMAKGFFKVGKRYFVQVSGGVGVSTHDYTQNSAVVTANQLNVTLKDQQVSFLIGLHFYPLKVFNLDNNFLGIKDAWFYHNRRVLKGRFWNHLSLYTGIGIPDPLKNFYGGISLDLLPGIRITGGEHFIIYTKYQVTNNVITDQANGFKGASPFVGLNIDADFIGKLFALFK